MPIRVITGVSLPTSGKLWPVPLYGQEASEWCWLACAQMAGDAPPWSANLQQCQLAQNYIPGATNCCTSKPPPAACNRGGAETTIQQIYADHPIGFEPAPVARPPDETQLLTWLAEGPVQVFWSTPDQAHVALIVGVKPIGAGKYQYIVNDPWPVGSGQVRLLTFDQIEPTIPSSYDWSWDYVWHC
jgi:papain like cysteine protease AvrRpt2